MNLYEMTRQEREILAQIEAAEGEMTDKQDAMLAQLDGDITAKIQSICKFVRSLEAESKALETERARMLRRINANAGKVLGLKKYIQYSMESLGKTEIKGTILTATLRKCPVSCVIQNGNHIPDKYKVAHTETRIDRAAIIADYKAHGITIPGVEMVTDRRTVQIG